MGLTEYEQGVRDKSWVLTRPVSKEDLAWMLMVNLQNRNTYKPHYLPYSDGVLDTLLKAVDNATKRGEI